MTRTQIPVYLTTEEVAALDAARDDRSRSAFLAMLLRAWMRARTA